MVATACVEQMCVLNGCMLCHGAELSAIVRGCPVWVGPHVVHPFTHSVITIHEFSCSCIRCSSCTHLLTLVCIQSCNFISCHTTSCHAMFNSAPLGSFIHLLHTRTNTHTHTLCSMTPTSPGQPWEPILQAGMQLFACSACSRGRGSGLPPSSASTFWQPRCLLLVARPQQTRLIEPTLYPNLVVRGWHRMLARQ